MDNQTISQIEKLLLQKRFDVAIDILERIRGNPTEYSTDSKYLLDYFLGQALFRRELNNERFDPNKLDRIISLYKTSLSQRNDFSDSHFLLGWAYLIQSRITNKTKSKENGIKHLLLAKKLNPTLSGECDKNLECLVEPTVILCHPDNTKAKIFRTEFKDYVNIEVVTGDILKQECDAIVSPANSFGFMDGGLDYKLRERFTLDIERRLQGRIRGKYDGELLVGQAEIIETCNERIPFLVCAPTMRIPKQLDLTSINAYLSTRAALRSIRQHNTDKSEEMKIQKVAFPFMCTGVGMMPYHISARQMRKAYKEIVLFQSSFPKDFGESQTKDYNLYAEQKLN